MDDLMLEIQNFLNQSLPEVVNCERCNRLCKLAPIPESKAKLLKRAKTPKGGLCINCSATSFIMSIPTLMVGINKNGVDILLNQHVVNQFTEVLKAGFADANPNEIDWELVVKNWHLPIKGSKK